MSKAANVTPETVARMVALRRKGWTQDRIAEALDLTRETVSRKLAGLARKAAAHLEDRAVVERVEQLDQLDQIADEALRAWERSLKDAETHKTVEAAEVDGDPTTRREKTVKGQSGNPALLGRAMDALAAKRSLLGLDAPQEVEHGGEVKIVVEYQDAPPPEAAPGAGGDPAWRQALQRRGVRPAVRQDEPRRAPPA